MAQFSGLSFQYKSFRKREPDRGKRSKGQCLASLVEFPRILCFAHCQPEVLNREESDQAYKKSKFTVLMPQHLHASPTPNLLHPPALMTVPASPLRSSHIPAALHKRPTSILPPLPMLPLLLRRLRPPTIQFQFHISQRTPISASAPGWCLFLVP